jgi:uncharacterized repeat protein (TIGR01451 family)
MNTKQFLVKSGLALICVIGLLSIGLWVVSTPRASTVGTFPFYSPIPPVGEPQIELVKTVDNANPTVDDEITYTLTYRNTSPGTQAFNVRLYDFIPAGVQFVSSNPAVTAIHNGALLFAAPSVGPTTDSVQVNVRVRVQEGYERLYNHALVMADGVAPVHAALLTNVTQPPRWLRLTKTGYSAVLINDELVYTLMCQNTGDTTVNDVTLVDVLPTGLPLVGASPAPDETALPVLSWSLGDLDPGERRTVVITTTAPASTGVITNTALADARQRVVTQTLFATQVISQGAILRVAKTGSAPTVRVDDELVYTLNYENAGNEVATTVRLSDTFPADISVTAASVGATSLTDQQGVWELGTLNPDDLGQVLITTTVEGQGGRTLRNLADITGQPGSFPGHAELETDVQPLLLYLPVVMQNY